MSFECILNVFAWNFYDGFWMSFDRTLTEYENLDVKSANFEWFVNRF